MAEQNRKTLRSFYCRDYLWELFEVMTRDLGCSMDYLINEAMRHYARSRNYSLTNARPQGQQPAGYAPPQQPNQAPDSPYRGYEGGGGYDQRGYGAPPAHPGHPPPAPAPARQPEGYGQYGGQQPQPGYGAAYYGGQAAPQPPQPSGGYAPGYGQQQGYVAAPAAAAIVPAAHGVGATLPVEQKCPALHAVQLSACQMSVALE